MRRAALGAALVTTALVTIGRTSAAQSKAIAGAPTASDSEAVLLLYEDSPPPECPTQTAFEAEVEKLTSRAHFTRKLPARRVRIELSSSSGSEVRGRLISGDGKNQSSREVRGKDCREVASALAIAVALTIDPEALGLGLGEAPPPPPPETRPPPPTVKPPPAPRPAKRARPRSPAPTRSKLRGGLGAGLVLENTWAPQMRPGAKVLGVLALGERVRAYLGLARFFTREVDDVSFGAWLADGALSFNLVGRGALRPFASIGFETGVVDASGSGLADSVQATRPWHAGNLGLGLQVGGSLLVPFSRQRYLVSDPVGKARTLYEVPDFGLKQETSLGVFL